MKQVTFSKSAFAVTAILAGLAAFVASACADNADVPAESTSPTDPTPAATIPPTATATPTEKKCPSSCKVDADCANACPAIPGGVQCCDTSSGTCMGQKTATCMATTTPPPDPGPSY